MFFFATVLVLLGLFGLYTSQSEAAGALGAVGFLLASLGTALLAGLSWAQAFVVPLVAAESPALLETEPVGSTRSFLEAVMNLIRNGLGMRKTETAWDRANRRKPHRNAVFSRVHNTL